MGHKWDRDAKRPPTLAEERANGPEEQRHRSRKDTKRWCRGKVGREHTPGVQFGQGGRWALARGEAAPCKRISRDDDWQYTLYVGSRQDTGTVWLCRHEDYCTTCGKVLSFDVLGLGKRCPDYQPE